MPVSPCEQPDNLPDDHSNDYSDDHSNDHSDDHSGDQSDEQLAQRVQSGDSAAFARLIERHYAAVFAFLYRMAAGQRAQAEDHTQETFLRVLRGIRTYDPVRPFRPWLFSIAANLARNQGTSAEARRTTPTDALDELPDEQADAAESILDALDRQQAAASVIEALDALSPDQRVVVTLFYYHDMAYSEIAAALHIPLGTVRSRLWAAVRRLRAHPHFQAMMLQETR